MQPTQAIEPASDGLVWIHAKVIPGSSRTTVAGTRGTRIRIKVAAPAEGGRANKALIKYFARVLRVSPSNIRLVRGMTSPEKTLELRGLSAEDVRNHLFGDSL